MPYKSEKDLPDSVKDHLPAHGQSIYLEAFNSAWEQYAEPEDRDGNDSREEVSHKVAWSAVKNSYQKKNDKWVKKKS